MKTFSETASLGIFYGFQVIQLAAIAAGITGLIVLLSSL
jgi:hypothetical protein